MAHYTQGLVVPIQTRDRSGAPGSRPARAGDGGWAALRARRVGPMELYLLRHAPAGVRDARRFPSDAERPLTRKGKLKMVLGARGMRTLGLEFDLMLTSPLVRARQTARIVRSVFRARGRVRLFRPLSPGVESESVVRALAGLPAAKRLLLVGHEPGLSQLAARLLAGGGTGGAALVLKKGGLCRIDFESGVAPAAGRLIFHLTPRVLRLLGRRPGRY